MSVASIEVNLHATKIDIEGQPFIVLPFEEFDALLERIEDLEDLHALDEAIKSNGGDPGVPYLEFREQKLRTSPIPEEDQKGMG